MLQLIFFSQVIFVCFFWGGTVMPTNEVETKGNENYLR